MLNNKRRDRLVKLSPLIREALAFAEAERALDPHRCLTTGHLLLGILRMDLPIVHCLREMGVILKQTRSLVRAAIEHGSLEESRWQWSDELKLLIEDLMQANRCANSASDDRFLILPLLKQPQSISSQILASLGVTEERLSSYCENLSSRS